MFKGQFQVPQEITVTKTPREKLIEFLEKERLQEQATNLKNISQSLNLNRKKIGDEGAKIIASTLKNNTTLTSLVLNCNNIGTEGVKKIAKVLKINTILTSLVFSYNNIGTSGGKLIAEALKNNKVLTKLDLSGCDIGNEGMKEIAEVLQTDIVLTILKLKDNNLTGNGVALDIGKFLKTNTVLMHLDLGHNYIGLWSGQFTEILKTNTVLTTLKLKNTYLGCNGAVTIAETLKTNTVLTHLKLKDNGIQINGAKAIVKALKTNTVLTNLDLEENVIRDEEKKTINKYLQKNIHSAKEKVAALSNIQGAEKQPDAFQKIVTEISTPLDANKTINTGDKAIMRCQISNIANKLLDFKDKEKVQQILEMMKQFINNNTISKRWLLDAEDYLDKEIELQKTTYNNFKAYLINEIVYDKPLLNHPKLLQAAVDNKLSSDLIHEAINHDDAELILAGLLSVWLMEATAG